MDKWQFTDIEKVLAKTWWLELKQKGQKQVYDLKQMHSNPYFTLIYKHTKWIKEVHL